MTADDMGRPRLDRPLILTGMPGVGKSTVGRIVADALGVGFVDLDEAIEAAEGAPAAALWQTDEPAFRAAEKRMLGALLDDRTVRVIAAGGGALLDAASRATALDRGLVVHLAASVDTLRDRLGADAASRPVLAAAGSDLSAALAAIAARRAATYAQTHAAVVTDGRDAAAVARAVLDQLDFSVWLPLGDRGYPIRVSADAPAAIAPWLAWCAPSSIVLVTDEGAAPWAAAVERSIRLLGRPPVATATLPPGEQHKTLATVERIFATLHAAGADRGTIVVAVGGGVVSDIAGLAAALWMRGIRWLSVPTTLLSMVDAAIGGKTAVDWGGAKNVVGAFHQPRAVFIDPTFVGTQSPRDFASGLAEAVKTGLIGDPELFDLLESRSDELRRRDPGLVRRVVERCVAVKAEVVASDERDTGRRAILNFGHTVGHAVEAYGRFERFTHGEAVAIGMVAMLELGVLLGDTDPALPGRAAATLARLGLPTSLPGEHWSAALGGISHDKKRRGTSVQVILLRTVGDPVLRYVPVDDVVRGVLAAKDSATTLPT